MKNCLFFSAWFFFSALYSYSKPATTIYEQLCAINKEWRCNTVDLPILSETTMLQTDRELVQLHLGLVEFALRNKDVSHLSVVQGEKRNHCLNILHNYWQKGVFPINLYHAERTPYFIDHLGTACAVGYLVIETGYSDFAHQIKCENNYAYIRDLENQYPFLNEWAANHGFSMDELAWIQPTYPCSGQNPTCYGFNDGSVNVQMPTDGTPPFSVSGPPCWGLGAGTYEYTITDSTGTVFIQTYTLVDPAPIEVTAQWISDATSSSSCDGSATVSSTGGLGSLTYSWIPCSGPGQVVHVQTAATLCPGEYKMVINDSNGCSGTSECITIDNLASIDEQATDFTYSIFPNPTSGILQLNLTGYTGNSRAVLTDLSGRIIVSMEIGENNTLDLTEFSLKGGCYFVRIDHEGTSVVEQIMLVR